jgi:hypothetical protein
MNTRTTLAGAALLAAQCAATAQTDPNASRPPPPPSCDAPEYRQFDFWIGDWDVSTPDGKAAGRNTITRVANGCALHENWVGRGGFTGQSLNGWNTRTQRWQQTWLDSSGGRLELVGQAEGDGLRLEGRTPHASDRERFVLQRIRWTPLPDGRVRQHWESSNDQGASWTTAFDGYYRKR